MLNKASNNNLKKAKTSKIDEYYTQLSDIERELGNYQEHFKNKVVFLNCDDPLESNFYFYFAQNFEFLGLKKLISTHFETEKPSYKLEIIADTNKDGKVNKLDTVKTPLKQNGDFRSPECVELLKEADVIVTNPPFSLFREYIAQLIKHNKKFLILGNINTISYKESFELLKENKMWLGYNTVRFFNTPDKALFETARTFWYTNLDIKKRHEDLILYKSYNEKDYPKYENYDAINVDTTKDIPMDYKGNMGVPITFMDKYNPDQFEIVALGIVGSIDFATNKRMEILDKNGGPTGKFTWNAKGTLYRAYNPTTDKSPAFKDVDTGELYTSIYARVIIRNKKI